MLAAPAWGRTPTDPMMTVVMMKVIPQRNGPLRPIAGLASRLRQPITRSASQAAG